MGEGHMEGGRAAIMDIFPCTSSWLDAATQVRCKQPSSEERLLLLFTTKHREDCIMAIITIARILHNTPCPLPR